MNNINLKHIKPQFMRQVILALRGDKTINQTVLDLRARFNVQNRPFNKSDFFEICESENVLVAEIIEMRKILGVYFIFPRLNLDTNKAICLNPILPKHSYLKIAYHELGHHFLHRHQMPTMHRALQPTLNNYAREAQANYFSDLMLSEVKCDEK